MVNFIAETRFNFKLLNDKYRLELLHSTYIVPTHREHLVPTYLDKGRRTRLTNNLICQEKNINMVRSE